MAHIDHIALWVKDLDTMCRFYAAAFGAEPGPLYENAREGFASRFLALGDGAHLKLMASPTLDTPDVHLLAPVPDARRLGLAYVAIALGSEELVDQVTHRLHEAGAPLVEGPHRTPDGYYESVLLDPEGNRIALTV